MNVCPMNNYYRSFINIKNLIANLIHDVRSPLACLTMLSDMSSSIPKDELEIIKNATSLIQIILPGVEHERCDSERTSNK